MGASRNVVLNWGLAPLNNPDRLKAMKAAYLTVIDPARVDPADEAKLQQVIADPSYASRRAGSRQGVGGTFPNTPARGPLR